MSFEPVTRWLLRCDGDTTRGPCTRHLVHPDSDDPDDLPLTVWRPALYERPALDAAARTELRYLGWLLVRDSRVLCPDHVTGLEYLARAALDGLPFDSPTPAELDQEDHQ